MTKKIIEPNTPAVPADEELPTEEIKDIEDEKDEEPPTEESEDDAEEAEDTDSEEEDTESSEDAEERLTIGDKDYGAEELDAILSEGARVQEYKKTHPGFDPIKAHQDMTKSRMELAETKRQLEKTEDNPTPAPAAKEKESTASLEGISPEDIKIIERVIEAQGFVRKDDLEAQRTKDRETSTADRRQTVTDEFLAAHPEYSQARDPGNVRWDALTKEYQLFDKSLRADPEQISALLERAHARVGGESASNSDLVKKIVQQQANKLGATAKTGGGGSAGKETPTTDSKYTDDQVRMVKGLKDKGYSDERIEHLINNAIK